MMMELIFDIILVKVTSIVDLGSTTGYIIGDKGTEFKTKRRSDPELPWEYASQIFTKMLSQVCYKDFFEKPHMEYQEVTTSLQQL
jgi:hypothetical protein